MSYSPFRHPLYQMWRDTLKKALIVSLILHLAMMLAGYDLGQWFESTYLPQLKKLEAERQRQNVALQIQQKERYVPFAVAANESNRADPNARFKSDKNQLVAKESMARPEGAMGLGLRNQMAGAPQPSLKSKQEEIAASLMKLRAAKGLKNGEQVESSLEKPKTESKNKGEKTAKEKLEKTALKNLYLSEEEIDTADLEAPVRRGEEAGDSNGKAEKSQAGSGRDQRAASSRDAMIMNRLRYTAPDRSNENAFYLPNSNVAMGNITLLNTFYSESASFDRRVYEALLPLWNQEIYGLPPGLTGNLTPANYVSSLEIILDRLGLIKTVEVVGPSGVKMLDMAAYKAIMKMQAFPNPPDLFKTGPDEFTLRFQFNLTIAKGSGGRR